MIMNTLIRVCLILFGIFLIIYVGLYHCGYLAVTDLIEYWRCDWSCVEETDIVCAAFKAGVLLELSVIIGIWLQFAGFLLLRPEFIKDTSD